MAFRTLLCTTQLVLLLLLTRQSMASPVLDICVDENPWPPYTYWDKTSTEPQFEGYTISLAQAMLTGLKQDYHIQRLPWTEVHQLAQSTSLNAGCDMILDISATFERQQYLFFTQPTYQLYYSLVYSKKRFTTQNIPTAQYIKNYKICGVKSYNYGVLDKKLDIIREDSIQAVLNKLKTKECDFFAVEAPVLQYGIKIGLYQFSDMACLDLEDVTKKSYRLAVAKRSPDAVKLIKNINNQLNLLRKKGEMAAIAKIHGVSSDICEHKIWLGQ